MRLSLVPFRASHLSRFEVAAFQASAMERVRASNLVTVEQAGLSYTAFIDGDVVGCGGLVVTDRVWAWALLSDMGPSSFGRVHRIVRNALDVAPYRPIWARTVDHAPAQNWIKRLGFKFHHISSDEDLPRNVYVRSS